jgi:hypothetical protein
MGQIRHRVLATAPIAKGEVILRSDASRLVDDAHPLRPERGEYEHHCDWLAGSSAFRWYRYMPVP